MDGWFVSHLRRFFRFCDLLTTAANRYAALAVVWILPAATRPGRMRTEWDESVRAEDALKSVPTETEGTWIHSEDAGAWTVPWGTAAAEVRAAEMRVRMRMTDFSTAA